MHVLKFMAPTTNCCQSQETLMSPEFEQQIVDLLPKMRAWAWYLTHDVTAADDLVQDVALKTLSAFESFTPGTNFSAWVRKIMNNHFMSGIRQKREMTTLEHMPAWCMDQRPKRSSPYPV